jgi:HTH-type transcriptional regulator/antitoxin HigA
VTDLDYAALLSEIAPRVIHDDAEHERQLAEIDCLMQHGQPSDDVLHIIELLAMLIEQYEHERYPVSAVSPGQMIEHLLEARGIGPAEFAAAVRLAPEQLEEILDGTREPTVEQARQFGSFFSVSPVLFLQLD